MSRPADGATDAEAAKLRAQLVEGCSKAHAALSEASSSATPAVRAANDPLSILHKSTKLKGHPRAELNGQQCTAVAYSTNKKEYAVTTASGESMWVKQAHLESLAPAAGSPQKPAAGSPTDATLAKYRAKLEDWLAAKLATYDKDAAVRAKENAKHGNRAGYNEYLCRLRDQKYDAEVDKKVREAAGIVQKANSQGLVEGRVPPPRSLAAGPAPAPAPHAEARSGKPPQSTRV